MCFPVLRLGKPCIKCYLDWELSNLCWGLTENYFKKQVLYSFIPDCLNLPRTHRLHVSSRHSCRDATAEHIKGKEDSEKELYPEAISKLRRRFYVGHLVRNRVAQHILHFALQHFRTDIKSSDSAILLLSDTACLPQVGPRLCTWNYIWVLWLLLRCLCYHLQRKSGVHWNLADNLLFCIQESPSNSHLANLYN